MNVSELVELLLTCPMEATPTIRRDGVLVPVKSVEHDKIKVYDVNVDAFVDYDRVVIL
jgi:hypothetical protein